MTAQLNILAFSAVLRLSLTIPNLIWFAPIFFPEFCSQPRIAVVRWQPFVNLYEHMEHVSVKFVLKLFKLFQSNLAIVMLAQDALKERVGSSLCKYKFDCHPIKMCIVQDKPIVR